MMGIVSASTNKNTALVTGFQISTTAENSTSSACSLLNTFETNYHNGLGALPVVGDTIYVDEGITAKIGFGGLGLWWRLEANFSVFEIDNNGVVIAMFDCSLQ